MRNETCCFTGHRNIPENEYGVILAGLEKAVVDLILKGVRFFGTGGALGFDTMAAQTVLKLKNQYPHIYLILVLPCRTQTKGWKEADRRIYEHILSKADKVVYIADEYERGCMQRRNRHLVDNSAYCICYQTKETGGTAYTVRYAQQKGLRLIRLISQQYMNVYR